MASAFTEIQNSWQGEQNVFLIYLVPPPFSPCMCCLWSMLKSWEGDKKTMVKAMKMAQTRSAEVWQQYKMNMAVKVPLIVWKRLPATDHSLQETYFKLPLICLSIRQSSSLDFWIRAEKSINLGLELLSNVLSAEAGSKGKEVPLRMSEQFRATMLHSTPTGQPQDIELDWNTLDQFLMLETVPELGKRQNLMCTSISKFPLDSTVLNYINKKNPWKLLYKGNIHNWNRIRKNSFQNQLFPDFNSNSKHKPK